jgi:hypothetical protein
VDIGAWLHGLGLPQCEQAFRDNAIDATVLTELPLRISRTSASTSSGIDASCSLRSPRCAARADRPQRRVICEPDFLDQGADRRV